jgi:hypothetical protein
VVGWLTRSQDRGGTNRTPGVRPDEKPPPRAFAGSDAARFAATLAKAVTLTEEDLR